MVDVKIGLPFELRVFLCHHGFDAAAEAGM